MDEKTPILPPPAVSNCQCRCRSDKKKRVFKRIALFLIGLLALHAFSHRFQSFRSNWDDGVVSAQCYNGEAPIQWEGKTSYDVDPAKFPNLSVMQNGSITGGFVKTFTQSDDDLAHINVNIHFSEPYLQDQINIIIDDSENGYNFTVETPKHLRRECINVEITIALPNSAQFNKLAISTINSKIELLDDISTEESISLQTINGSIHAEYVKTNELVVNTVNGGITIEKADAHTVVFHSVNGAIHANVDAEKISAKTINGSIHLDNIGDGTAAAINTETVNGSTHVSAPKNFEGAFSLKTVYGKPNVFSQSKSDKLHIEKARRNAMEGYYGSPVEDSYISSETRMGSITMKFE